MNISDVQVDDFPDPKARARQGEPSSDTGM